jgi:hypothetical protein
VDQVLHHLQGKTEGVTTTSQRDLQALLTAVAAERLSILERHEAGARVVGHYDFNNTYQYVVSREETHLQWLQSALAELASQLPGSSSTIPVPAVQKKGRTQDAGAYRGILEDDAKTLRAFVERWRPKVDALTHARHRTMLGVILGESLEHARLFEQAASGFEDVLGRRTEHASRVGEVLPTRWQE